MALPGARTVTPGRWIRVSTGSADGLTALRMISPPHVACGADVEALEAGCMKLGFVDELPVQVTTDFRALEGILTS